MASGFHLPLSLGIEEAAARKPCLDMSSLAYPSRRSAALSVDSIGQVRTTRDEHKSSGMSPIAAVSEPEPALTLSATSSHFVRDHPGSRPFGEIGLIPKWLAAQTLSDFDTLRPPVVRAGLTMTRERSNQNVFRIANEKTTFPDAFAMADRVLYSGVACITALIAKEGLINL